MFQDHYQLVFHRFKAVGKGKTKITVKTTDGKKKAVCTVTVKIPAKKVTMNVKDIYVVKGKKVSLKAVMNKKTAVSDSMRQFFQCSKLSSFNFAGFQTGSTYI